MEKDEQFIDFYIGSEIMIMGLRKRLEAIGVFGISSANIYKNIISVDYKLSLDDLYIGTSGTHPRSKSFTLNRLNSDIDVSSFINPSITSYLLKVSSNFGQSTPK